jgi:hypothetical protein
MAKRQRARLVEPIEEETSETTAPEDAGDTDAVDEAVADGETTDRSYRPLYDEEDLDATVETLPVHEMLAKLVAIEPYLAAYFYSNPRGYMFKSMMSRKRRARRKKVVKLLDEIIDAVKYDDFLAQMDGGSYL